MEGKGKGKGPIGTQNLRTPKQSEGALKCVCVCVCAEGGRGGGKGDFMREREKRHLERDALARRHADDALGALRQRLRHLRPGPGQASLLPLPLSESSAMNAQHPRHPHRRPASCLITPDLVIALIPAWSSSSPPYAEPALTTAHFRIVRGTTTGQTSRPAAVRAAPARAARPLFSDTTAARRSLQQRASARAQGPFPSATCTCTGFFPPLAHSHSRTLTSTPTPYSLTPIPPVSSRLPSPPLPNLLPSPPLPPPPYPSLSEPASAAHVCVVRQETDVSRYRGQTPQ